MKKKICVLLCGLALILGIVGCGKTVVDETGVAHEAFGRFVVISEENYWDNDGNAHSQYITYDKDTKIMYIVDTGIYKFSITPFYVMNENNEPVIGVYNGDLEDAE